MPNMKLRGIGLVLGVVGVAAVAGCAAPTDGETQVAGKRDGLTIVTADETTGKLVASFRKDGREVSFELRLGPKMENPPEDPSLSSFEIDARILDGDGRPMYMQMAGDQFMDPTWRMPAINGVDADGRAKDFRIAEAAESAFASMTLPASLAQLRLGAMELARGLHDIAVKPGEAATAPLPTEPSTGDGTLSPKGSIYWSSTSSVYYWDYQVWKKTFAAIGHHSAVRLRGWNSSKSFLFGAGSCNHGTCTSVSPMEVSCTKAGWLLDDGTNSRYFYAEPSTTTDSVKGGCSTPYYLIGATGHHNCNDDSTIQVAAIEYDRSQDTTGGTCGDWYGHAWAPGCY